MLNVSVTKSDFFIQALFYYDMSGGNPETVFGFGISEKMIMANVYDALFNSNPRVAEIRHQKTTFESVVLFLLIHLDIEDEQRHKI